MPSQASESRSDVDNMRVEDVYVQGRRTWVRLHEKGGKRHEMPCHHKLEEYLNEYIQAADIGTDPKGFLFRTRDMNEEPPETCFAISNMATCFLSPKTALRASSALISVFSFVS